MAARQISLITTIFAMPTTSEYQPEQPKRSTTKITTAPTSNWASPNSRLRQTHRLVLLHSTAFRQNRYRCGRKPVHRRHRPRSTPFLFFKQRLHRLFNTNRPKLYTGNTSILAEIFAIPIACSNTHGQYLFYTNKQNHHGQMGDFTISITDPEPLYGTGVAGNCSPVNNECATASPVTVQDESCSVGAGTFELENYGQPSISPNIPQQNCGTNCGNTWFTFTMPPTGIALIEGNDDDINGGFRTRQLLQLGHFYLHRNLQCTPRPRRVRCRRSRHRHQLSNSRNFRFDNLPASHGRRQCQRGRIL